MKAYFDKKARLSTEAQQGQQNLTAKLAGVAGLGLPQAVPAPASPKPAETNLIFHEQAGEPAASQQ
jgi:hypothetical protein